VLNQDLPMHQFEPKMVKRGLGGVPAGTPVPFDEDSIRADVVPVMATGDDLRSGD